MRILVFGQKAFGAMALRALAAEHQVLLVSSPPFAGDESRPDRTRAEADRLGVPWIPAGTLTAAAAPECDVLVAAHAHDFLGAKLRARAKFGALGYHPSLLPIHRGRDAVRWTIKMRDRVAGGSAYWLTNQVDGGPIAAQRHVLVRPTDTAEILWRERLAPLGVHLLVSVLRDVAAGRLVRVPQDESCATWEPSFQRAPLYRPELLQLGDGSAAFLSAQTTEEALYV